MTNYYHSGVALAKKKGKDIHIVETPVGIGDMLPVIAEGSSVPRVLSKRFADVLNVKDFGAVGDGVTDDVGSFESAVATGKKVFIPSGNYRVSKYVYGDFVAIDAINFTDKNLMVKVLADTDCTFKKSVVAELPYNFDGYETALSVIGADFFSVQGISYDNDGNLYLLFEGVKGSSSVKTVIVKYDCQYSFVGYVILPQSTENIIVTDDIGGRSIFVRDNSTKELFKYNIENVEFNGRELFGTAVIEDVNGEYSYENGIFYVFSGSPDFPAGPASRTLIKKYNKNFEYLGSVSVPQTVTGFISTSAPYYQYIPKAQGFCVSGGNFYFEHGNGWIPPENDESATAYTYYKVHDVGCSRLSTDGKTVLQYGVVQGWGFVKRLREKGFDVTKLETEGCTKHPDGSIHGCYLTKEPHHTGLNTTGILIIREFDSNGDNYSDITSEYSPIDIQRYINGSFPTHEVSGKYTYIDPFSLKKITKLSEMLDLMVEFSIPRLCFYTGTLSVTPVQGIEFAENNFVELNNSNNVSVFITVSVAGSESNQGKRFYYATNYSGEWIGSPKNITVGRAILDTSGGGELVILGDNNMYTSVISTSKDADDTYRLRFGSSKSSLNGSSVIEFWGANGSSRKRVFAYQHSSLYPGEDQGTSLGAPSNRWSNIYSTTGAINTSDERFKTTIFAPDDVLMRAWGKVNFRVFQFKDAVEKKGADARLHVGVIAQQVIEAFASEGLDATRYGLLCYDKWDDEYEDVEVIDEPEVVAKDGAVTPAKTHVEHRLVTPAGDRYGIRYEEALALECAYQRWRLAQIEARLS